MGKFIDLIGQRFNYWTVIKRANNGKHKQTMWLCKCDCGNIKSITAQSLKTGSSTNCGCKRKKDKKVIYKKERKYTKFFGKDNPSYKHGLSKTKEYHRLCSILSSMRFRCYNKNNKRYKNYGGRGIKVCNEWFNKKDGMINFYNWAITNGYKLGLSIDRINNDGNYEPNNCRWVTNKKQQNNKRNNHYITYNDKTHTMMEWSEILNVNYNTLRGRINNYKWSVEKAFETPFIKLNKGDK